MKLFFRIFLVLAVLCCAYLANAQTPTPPKPGCLVVGQFKVALKDEAQFNAIFDSVTAPILNELVNEGKLIGWGQLTHAWGDEWNQNIYYTAESHEAFLDFWDEFFVRVSTRYPADMERFGKLVQDHKDNMYNIRNARRLKPATEGSFLVFHQNKVALKDVARTNALTDSLLKPVLDELVKEGKLLAWGQAMHTWGDDWNYNFYYVTESQKAFLSVWREAVARTNKRTPGWGRDFFPLFLDHKDNMYGIRKLSAR